MKMISLREFHGKPRLFSKGTYFHYRYCYYYRSRNRYRFQLRMVRTGFITSGVGLSPSEERRAKENEAAVVAGTTCRASWRSTWRHMQFDKGCAKTIPQSGTHWVACRMHAMHPEWSYETSSIILLMCYDLQLFPPHPGSQAPRARIRTCR
jgi:hypothetical protein